MLTITPIASGSSGNCYLIATEDSSILIECGIAWKRILKALNFDTSAVAGILASHEHQDHIKGAKDAAKSGMDIYCSKGTAEAVGLTGHRIHHIEALKQFSLLGGWIILPFDVEHDAAEPLGFLILKDQYKVLFLTDTSYCKYQFQGITHLMIEANFDAEILAKNIASGRVEAVRKQRLLTSHMSIQRVKDFIIGIDREALQEIHLIHLSNDNSNQSEFVAEVQRLTGVPVYVSAIKPNTDGCRKS